MTSTATTDLFSQEISAGVEFFTGGKDNFDFNPLTNIEELAVQKAWGKNLAFLNLIAPPLAAQFTDKRLVDANGNPMVNAAGKPVVAGHGTAMVKFAGIAKAIFPENKAITFPGEPGTIVADWITPQTAFWQSLPNNATAQTDWGAYSDRLTTSTTGGTSTGAYGQANTWDIVLTAGYPAYLFGSPGTSFYGASQTSEMHSLMVLAQNGLIEYGTTPKLSHIWFASQVQSKYAPIALQPMLQNPLGMGMNNSPQNIYQYNTLGVIPLLHNFGMKVGVMPIQSGKSHLQWLGMVFYEYSFLSTLASAYISG